MDNITQGEVMAEEMAGPGSADTVPLLALNTEGAICESQSNAHRHKSKSLWTLRAYVTSITVVLLVISFPPITRAFLALIPCRTVTPSARFMRADMSIACSSTRYQRISLLSAIFVFVFGLGFPLITAFLLRRFKTSLQSPWIAGRFGLLYKGFSESAYYFWSVLALKQFLLAVGLVLNPGNVPVQLSITVWVLLVEAGLVWKLQAYHGKEKMIELLAIGCTLMKTTMGFLFFGNATSSPVKFILGLLIVTADIIILLSFAAAIVWSFFPKFLSTLTQSASNSPSAPTNPQIACNEDESRILPTAGTTSCQQNQPFFTYDDKELENKFLRQNLTAVSLEAGLLHRRLQHREEWYQEQEAEHLDTIRSLRLSLAEAQQQVAQERQPRWRQQDEMDHRLGMLLPRSSMADQQKAGAAAESTTSSTAYHPLLPA